MNAVPLKAGRFTYAVVAMSVAQLMWAVLGYAANPDFSIGDDATAVKLFGVDFNGWHAVSGVALFLPALLLLKWPQFTRRYVYLVAISLDVTAVWALLDEHPLGLLFLPDGVADAVFHILSAAAFLLLLLLDKPGRHPQRTS